jgi:ATP-binding protein involved in chromosome partitioning
VFIAYQTAVDTTIAVRRLDWEINKGHQMAEGKTKHQPRHGAPQGMARVKHIIAIGSGKGGVGKSTVSTNFAIALRNTGAKVGLLDADIYGPSQPDMLGAHGEPQVRGEYLLPLKKHGLVFMSIGLLLSDDQPVIWRGPMASKMIQQFLGNVMWGELDYLLVDLPPGSGDVQITLAQHSSLTGAIIVTTPQQVALGVANKGLQMFKHVNVPIIGIIENMSGFNCPHCGENTPIFKSGGGEKLAETVGVNFLGGIPIDPQLMVSGDEGIPLLDKNIDSPSVKAFIELAQKFKTVMAKGIADPNEPKSINLSDDGSLAVEWPDGSVGTFSPYDLRVSCSCAACVNEDTGEKMLDPKQVPLDIKISGFEKVGRYAVGITFSDGHNSGIFKYDRLNSIEQRQKDSAGKTFNV